jgi:hypothetical protein
MQNKISALVIGALLFCLMPDTYAQYKRFLLGGTAGYQTSILSARDPDIENISNRGGWRVAVMADYALTSRLSVQGQVGVQQLYMGSLLGRPEYTVTYPEIWLGFTEYLPIGGGSLYANVSIQGGVGLGGKLPSGDRIFDLPGYNNTRLGWGALLGYVTRPGIFIQTGLQLNSFKSHYRLPNSGIQFNENSFHLISVGYWFQYKRRLLPRKTGA